MGTLYIVATPIGNLQDITFRAVEILSTVNILACEDTRRTGLLLHQLGIENKPHLVSFYEENEQRRIPEIITTLKNGTDVALVSDAGMPTISDPGFKLVRECIKEGIKVEGIPGATSVVLALAVSGLPTDKFFFVGYLPKKSGKREKLLQEIKSSQQDADQLSATIILFETPHRLIKTLEEMQVILGDIPIVLCRELTKIHEEIRRETIEESLKQYRKVNPKGEFVLLFNLNNN